MGMRASHSQNSPPCGGSSFPSSCLFLPLQNQQCSHTISSLDMKSAGWGEINRNTVVAESGLSLLFSLAYSLPVFCFYCFLLACFFFSRPDPPSLLLFSSNLLLSFCLKPGFVLFPPCECPLLSAGFWQSLWARWETCRWTRQSWAAFAPSSSSTQVPRPRLPTPENAKSCRICWIKLFGW